MKILAFTIYDEKAEAFGTPLFSPAIGQASRMFADLANNKETAVGAHPEDYTLYHIGYYESENGRMDNTTTPIFIGKATDYVDKAEPLAPPRIKGIQNA